MQKKSDDIKKPTVYVDKVESGVRAPRAYHFRTIECRATCHLAFANS